jgi:hypothetical protein
MKLTLDHTQRLKIADEEKAIELKREFVGGQERVTWNPSLAVTLKEFDFADAELARIKLAVEVWAGYGVSSDRCWLEPLLAVVFDDPGGEPNSFTPLICPTVG